MILTDVMKMSFKKKQLPTDLPIKDSTFDRVYGKLTNDKAAVCSEQYGAFFVLIFFSTKRRFAQNNMGRSCVQFVFIILQVDKDEKAHFAAQQQAEACGPRLEMEKGIIDPITY